MVARLRAGLWARRQGFAAMSNARAADLPHTTTLLVALATRDERLALILGPPQPWVGTPAARLASLSLPSALARPDAGRDEALALGARLLGLDLEPVASRWTYGPSTRHAMDRAPSSDASEPLLRYERLDVGADLRETNADEPPARRGKPTRVMIHIYLARARGRGAAGVVWLPLAALRASLAGLWLPELRALERVEFAAETPDAPDETLIFTPATAGERQLLRACAKYGDAILFPAR